MMAVILGLPDPDCKVPNNGFDVNVALSPHLAQPLYVVVQA
jgi:hypothetical protein